MHSSQKITDPKECHQNGKERDDAVDVKFLWIPEKRETAFV
jgi:hypothetical protein